MRNAARRGHIAVAACIVLFAMAAAARAQDVAGGAWPDRPIRLIVPSAPGGPTDIPARLLSQHVLTRLGQPVVIENRPGAGGAIGARFVAGATPDGYTLLVGNTSVLAVIPAVSGSAGYDPARHFTAVAQFSQSCQILVVRPQLAAGPFGELKSVGELIAYAQAHPGRLSYAHSGAGGLPHLTGELFKSAAGVDILSVPYKSGGESVTALLGGQVDMTFESITILLPLIQEGRLRALAVTGRSRTPLTGGLLTGDLPTGDLPTMIEAGVPGFEVTTFNGVVAPAGTPAPVVARLNAAINDGLRTPAMQASLRNLGAVAAPASPAEFSAFIAAEARKWSAAARAANVHVD
jgi:tripartite-type tricarboxylate transporter receptor subunit TctC